MGALRFPTVGAFNHGDGLNFNLRSPFVSSGFTCFTLWYRHLKNLSNRLSINYKTDPALSRGRWPNRSPVITEDGDRRLAVAALIQTDQILT